MRCCLNSQVLIFNTLQELKDELKTDESVFEKVLAVIVLQTKQAIKTNISTMLKLVSIDEALNIDIVKETKDFHEFIELVEAVYPDIVLTGQQIIKTIPLQLSENITIEKG